MPPGSRGLQPPLLADGSLRRRSCPWASLSAAVGQKRLPLVTRRLDEFRRTFPYGVHATARRTSGPHATTRDQNRLSRQAVSLLAWARACGRRHGLDQRAVRDRAPGYPRVLWGLKGAPPGQRFCRVTDPPCPSRPPRSIVTHRRERGHRCRWLFPASQSCRSLVARGLPQSPAWRSRDTSP